MEADISLLTMVQTICEEVGLAAPVSVAGNTDRTAKQIMRLLNRTGQNLLFQPWHGLQREYTFTTANGVEDYVIPEDVNRFIDGTAWDRSNYWQLRGGLSPQEWQVRRSALAVSVTSRKRFRLLHGDTGATRIHFDPVPTAAEDMVIEYYSNRWVIADDATKKFQLSADTDEVFGMPYEVVEMGALWRFKAAKGLAYEEERQEWERQVSTRIGAGRLPQTIDFGGQAHDPFGVNIRETGFGD